MQGVASRDAGKAVFTLSQHTTLVGCFRREVGVDAQDAGR